MMRLPPGLPITCSRRPPFASYTRNGAMELRGRLPGATALATARPILDRLEVEVGELVVEQEAAHHLLRPKKPSMVVVIETALPCASTMAMWLVPAISSTGSSASATLRPGGVPGCALPMDFSAAMSFARSAR